MHARPGAAALLCRSVLFSGNQVNGSAGALGLYGVSGEAFVSGCTFSGNSAK